MFNRNDPERAKRGKDKAIPVYDLEGAIPWSGDFTAQRPAENNRHRLRLFRKILGYDSIPENLKVLDIGKSNFIGRHLGATHNTVGDLNKGINKIIIQRIVEREVENPKTEDSLVAEKLEIVPATDGVYDAVFSFEIYSHNMNILQLTQHCNKVLKLGGSLFLTTPLPRLIAWEHGRGNMVEYKKSAVEVVHQYCGFKPVRYETHNPWPFSFVFYGIRPPFRWIHNRFQFWEFIKVSEIK